MFKAATAKPNTLPRSESKFVSQTRLRSSGKYRRGPKFGEHPKTPNSKTAAMAGETSANSLTRQACSSSNSFKSH